MDQKKDGIYVVISFRDRLENNNLENCFYSLANQSLSRKKYELLIVDFGSQIHISKECQNICSFYKFNYIKSHSQKEPWNRAHALNIGIKKSNRKFTLTTDIDIIFKTNFLQTVLESLNKFQIANTQFCVRSLFHGACRGLKTLRICLMNTPRSAPRANILKICRSVI